MKTKLPYLLFIVLLFFLHISPSYAQCDETITLNSQTAVDAFLLEHGCSVIEQDLIISGPFINN